MKQGGLTCDAAPQVASDFVAFLRNFYAIFPRYAKMELYLSGESFAGTFIPYIAKHILDVNKQQGSAKVSSY